MLNIVNTAIDQYMDVEQFEKIMEQEAKEKGQIIKMINNLNEEE